MLPFSTSEHCKDGRLRGLATSGAKRSAALPDLPTFIEAGYPEIELDLWLGIFAPANTPAASVARINAEIRSRPFRARRARQMGAGRGRREAQGEVIGGGSDSPASRR